MTDREKPFTEYAVEYQHKGARWGLTIKAASWEDAEDRLKAIGAWGRVVGSGVITIPASLGVFAKAWVWIANAWRTP